MSDKKCPSCGGDKFHGECRDGMYVVLCADCNKIVDESVGYEDDVIENIDDTEDFLCEDCQL